MYLITVMLQNELKFKVEAYEKKDGRITFTDKFTGLNKDFPGNICLVEEVK